MPSSPKPFSPGAQKSLDALAVVNIVILSKFTPFSLSRNKGEKRKSLNWRVTLAHKGQSEEFHRPSLTTDYMAGEAHCPSYKQGNLSVDERCAIDLECENGRRLRSNTAMSLFAEKIEPNSADIVSSLMSDAGVIDYGSFEEWAKEFDYSPDSRSAERIYQTCLENTLKLRAAIGDANLQKLREACQDY